MMISTGHQVVSALGRLRWTVSAARVIDAAMHCRDIAAKANFNPNQPREPRGNGRESGQWRYVEGWAGPPGSSGGVRPARPAPSRLPIARVSEQVPDPQRPPSVPRIRPSSGRARNAVVKDVAHWLLRLGRLGLRLSPLGRLIDAYEFGSWIVDEYWPYLEAYIEEPKTFDELQRAVGTPRKGTDIHHIVERTSALADGLAPDWVDGPENLVRISTLKHWELNSWYERPNEDFGGRTPRAYLKGKTRDERIRVGLRGLEAVGVIKP